MPLLEEIDRVLATGGQAREDLLLTAFADALQAAVNAYEQHGMHVPPDLVKRTTVTFEYQLGPVQTVLPIQLSAVTTLTDPGQLAAGVGVLVSPAGLDKVTAFSLPYVLLHECVCHVLQGPWQPGRIQNDPGDRFAEGWMDVAAYLVHEMTEWPRHTAKPDQLIRDEQSAAATKVHHARQERQPHDRAWAARAMGAMAARGTLKLLGSLPESRNDAENAFLCLTLHLNASSYPNGDRALFVLKVYQALQRRADHQLTPLLRAYLSTGALDPLVTGVLPLFD